MVLAHFAPMVYIRLNKVWDSCPTRTGVFSGKIFVLVRNWDRFGVDAVNLVEVSVVWFVNVDCDGRGLLVRGNGKEFEV